MKVIKAPKKFYKDYESGMHLFLAGSIEMGKAENWQSPAKFKDIKECLLF